MPETIEQGPVTCKETAVEQGEGELHIFRIEAVALRQSAGGGTELEAGVPQFLREGTYLVTKFLFTILAAMKKQQVDIGMGGEPAPSVAAKRDEGETFRLIGVGRDEFLPEANAELVDQSSTLGKRSRAVEVAGEVLLNLRGFLGVESTQAVAR